MKQIMLRLLLLVRTPNNDPLRCVNQKTPTFSNTIISSNIYLTNSAYFNGKVVSKNC